MRAPWMLFVPLSLVVGYLACDAGGGSGLFDESVPTTTGPSGQGGAGTTTSAGGGDWGWDAGFDDAGQGDCQAGPDEDLDGDGFTILQGDCNDCDPNVNPNAVEVMTPSEPQGDGGVPVPADEDCDGAIDNLPPPCDGPIPVGEMNPFVAAGALELCKVSAGPGQWGIADARWVMPNGNAPGASGSYDLGHGVVNAFGPAVHVQAGSQMLVLSSGTARQPTDPGYVSPSGFDKNFTCGHPQGFPKESPACPGVFTGTPHDGVGLEVVLRVPSNAKGFSFDFNFYTYEWPGYICSQYNDFFVALLMPFPSGQSDGNISFDSVGNPVSVNNALLAVCGCSGGPPCPTTGPPSDCPLGDSELLGTGFGPDTEGLWHAATSWLYTTAPIETPEITVRWAVYDSGDGVLDSTTLIDNWQWIAEAGTKVGTEHVPDPK